MSSLSINSVNPYQNYSQNAYGQGQSNMQTLANALQSGNVSAAQTAFTSLEQTFQNQNGQQSSTQSSQSNPVNNDIQSLANALNSGNLSSAQQAFAQLQKDMVTQQASGHHHHHHGGGSDGGQAQAIQSLVSSLSSNSSTSSSSSSTTGNTLNVTA